MNTTLLSISFKDKILNLKDIVMIRFIFPLNFTSGYKSSIVICHGVYNVVIIRQEYILLLS